MRGLVIYGSKFYCPVYFLKNSLSHGPNRKHLIFEVLSFFTISEIKRAINSYGEVTAGKNDNALRSFIFPKAAIHILEQQKEQIVRHSILSSFVFPSPDGGNLLYRTYYKHWKAFCLYNDILPCSLYEMRHTFFSFNKTAPQELIKLVGGHSSAFDTFGVYGHELLGEAEKAAAIIDETFQKYIQ